MKNYEGFRTRCGMCLVTVTGCSPAYVLPYRTELWNHSPSGLEWGYHGSGPAQLALALLADATDNDAIALGYYQEFRAKVVANLPKNGWSMSELDILRWLKDQLAAVLDLPLCYQLATETKDGGKSSE